MRLVWHIAAKDARRLWWQILLPAAMLAWLAVLDATRTGATPGALEGWLHLLLLVAWTVLLAAAVAEDSPIGDRPFWKTLPLRWSQIAGAKVLFALIAIHLPLLAAHLFVLAKAGFAPWEHLPRLLARQTDVLLLMTLPSLALGASVASLAQFVAIALPAAGLMAWMANRGLHSPWQEHTVELILSGALLTAGAVLVLLAQYRWRTVRRARIAGVCTVLAAAALYLWLPRAVAASFQAALSPAPAVSREAGLSISIAPAPPAEPSPATSAARGFGIAVAIPLAVIGWPAAGNVVAANASVELETAQGERVAADWPSAFQSYERVSLQGHLWQPRSGPPQWQILQMRADLYRRLQDSPVTLRSRSLLHFQRSLPAVEVKGEGMHPVAGLGSCSVETVSGYLGRAMLRASCQSPAPVRFGARVRLTEPGTGREWLEYLGGARTLTAVPQLTPFSPLYRREAFFHIAGGEMTADAPQTPGSRWLLPAAAAASAKVEFLPVAYDGARLVDYELRGIRLADFAAGPQR